MDQTAEIKRLNELLVDLQTQVAFQEQSISELSRALAIQQDDIVRIKREWRRVEEQYASLQAQLTDGEDERDSINLNSHFKWGMGDTAAN